MSNQRNSPAARAPLSLVLGFGAGLSFAWAATHALAAPITTISPAAAPSTAPTAHPKPPAEAPTLAPSSLPADSLEIDNVRREWNARRIEAARALRRIRAEHFRTTRDEDVRKAGIAKLATFTDGASFAAMIEVFRNERGDVQQAVANHLSRVASPEAVATLTFIAIYERDPEFRAKATRRLESLTTAGFPPASFDDQAASNATPTANTTPDAPGNHNRAGPSAVQILAAAGPKVPARLTTAVVAALDGNDRAAAGNAARLVQSLGLIQAIPQLIMAQAGGSGGGGGGGDGGGTAIAWCQFGNQRAFIADLTPVTSEGAVGFDPTPGVIVDGVVLAINDAAVVTYVSNPDVHAVLVGMSSNLTGQDTSAFKRDPRAWARWYQQSFLPQMAELADRKAADRAAAQAKAADQARAKVQTQAKAAAQPAAKP